MAGGDPIRSCSRRPSVAWRKKRNGRKWNKRRAVIVASLAGNTCRLGNGRIRKGDQRAQLQQRELDHGFHGFHGLEKAEQTERTCRRSEFRFPNFPISDFSFCLSKLTVVGRFHGQAVLRCRIPNLTPSYPSHRIQKADAHQSPTALSLPIFISD